MTDLIERDEALRLIAEEQAKAKYGMEDCALYRASKIVRELPAANSWIPCNERLPKVGIPVLIYDKHHKAFFVAKLDEDYFGFSSNMWHHPADVPFWMPLPEPPESEVQDEAQP